MDIPSMETVFHKEKHALNVLRKAQFTSVVPVTLLPWEVLVEYKGIGVRTAHRITAALEGHGLRHRTLNESMTDFAEDQYGRINKAPVAVLNVLRIHSTTCTRPYYAPLRMLRLLENVQPHLRLFDLMAATHDELIQLVEEKVAYGPELMKLRSELDEINWRMQQWNPRAFIGIDHEVPQRPQLTVVRT